MKVSRVPFHALVLAPSRGLCCVRVLFPALSAVEITWQNCPEIILGIFAMYLVCISTKYRQVTNFYKPRPLMT